MTKQKHGFLGQKQKQIGLIPLFQFQIQFLENEITGKMKKKKHQRKEILTIGSFAPVKNLR